MTQRSRIEWKGANGRIYGKKVPAGEEVRAYRTILEQTIVDYEKLLLKYAPDWKQQRLAELERLAREHSSLNPAGQNHIPR